MLITKYGLAANDPYQFTVYEREVPLMSDLAQLQDPHDPKLGCAASPPPDLVKQQG